jgi:hypothetical protein
MEREIARQIASDPDVPEMAAADLRWARRVYHPSVPNVTAIPSSLNSSASACALFNSGNRGGQCPTVPLGHYCASLKPLRKWSSERWLPAVD